MGLLVLVLAASTAQGQTTTLDPRVPPPPKGMGQVVFFRPKAFFGMALSFSIHEGGKGVAKLSNGSYAVVAATPGQHEYTTQFEATDVLHIEVEEGETSYVAQGIGQGENMARPFLAPSDEAAFLQSDPRKMKATKLVPTDRKPSGPAVP